MANVKMVIVMRKDLNMRRGKQIAQGCHASMKVFLDMDRIYMNVYPERQSRFNTKSVNDLLIVGVTSEMQEWIDGIFTKICVSVDSEQELLDIYNKAKEVNLPCALITDSGATEFNGVPTKTCCAIGPAKAEDIDKITGGLKLL